MNFDQIIVFQMHAHSIWRINAFVKQNIRVMTS
jgi:hypothetical protein